MKKFKFHYLQKSITCFSLLTIAILSFSCEKMATETNNDFSDETTFTKLISESELNNYFLKYDVLTLDLEHLYTASQQNAGVSFPLPVSGKGAWNVQVFLNDMRAPDYQAVKMTNAGPVVLPREPATTYQGSLDGNSENHVRLTIAEDHVRGMLIKDGVRYFLEPLNEFVLDAPPEKHLLYRSEDVIASPKLQCLAGDVGNKEMDLSQAYSKALAVDGYNCHILQLATDADFEYYDQYGHSTNNRIQDILNVVEGLYIEADFHIDIEITYQNYWTISRDPYRPTDPAELLAAFKGYWRTKGNVQRDLFHLWTGRDLDGTTIGFAYIGVLCVHPDFSYGLSQRYSAGAYGEYVLTAHEIGHNLSGIHEDGENCDSGGNGTIMCPQVQTKKMVFSDASQCRITQFTGGSNSHCLEETTVCLEGPSACRMPPANNQAVAMDLVQNFSIFAHANLKQNIGDLKKLLIRHRRELGNMLREDNAKTAAVRKNLATFIEQSNPLLASAFRTRDGRDQIEAEHVATIYQLFEAIERNASDKLNKDLQYFKQFLPVMKGRDLQNALMAFDKARPGDFKG